MPGRRRKADEALTVEGLGRRHGAPTTPRIAHVWTEFGASLARLLAVPDDGRGTDDTRRFTPLAVMSRRTSVLALGWLHERGRQRRVFLKKLRPDVFGREGVVARAAKEFDVLAMVHMYLSQEDGIGTVAPIAVYPEEGTLVTEEFPGVSLMSVVRSKGWGFPSSRSLEALVRYCRLTGHWLARFQALTAQPGWLDVEELIEYTDARLRRLVANPRAPLDQRLRTEVLRYIESRRGSWTAADLALAGSSGDFVPANILVGGGRIAVVDFGSYRQNSKFCDIAQFYQHLGFFAQKIIYRRPVVERLRREFLVGYDPGLDPRHSLFKVFRIQRTLTRMQAYTGRKWATSPVWVKTFQKRVWMTQVAEFRALISD